MANKKKLLTIDQASPVNIPNYISLKDLQKENLLNYCLSKNNLLQYLPESTNLKSIPRDFLLMVRF